MNSKFNIGDKVVLTHSKRTSKEILNTVRLDHPRTIIGKHYNPRAQHTFYILGHNHRGTLSQTPCSFRSCQLKKWVRGNIGRPRVKRQYKGRNIPMNSKPPV